MRDGDSINGKRIVYKVGDDENPREVYASTYQMRNFYAQFADGFFSSLDVMNYMQHHAAVLKMKKGWRVLDVCCGRGLLLPMIRYYRSDIAEYIGIDLSERNISEQLRRSGIKKIEDAYKYYPFKLTHIVDSVEFMDKYIESNSIDFIIYTSSIEHMQKDVGYKSLQHCFSVLKPEHQMFFSCPNTTDKKDPYDTQYAAHVYEWDIHELRKALKEVGFEIEEEYGLVVKVKKFEKWLEERGDFELIEQYKQLKKYLPTAWLMPYIALLYPEAADEVLIIVKKPSLRKLF